MMLQLNVREGDIVVAESVSLPLATYSKFQPQDVNFLDIHNPKAVYVLRSCNHIEASVFVVVVVEGFNIHS